jgi:hypothetical protein
LIPVPVLFGAGRRLFEVLPSCVELQVVRVIKHPLANGGPDNLQQLGGDLLKTCQGSVIPNNICAAPSANPSFPLLP